MRHAFRFLLVASCMSGLGTPAVARAGDETVGTQESDRLVRGEETKGTVELGDLKFLGEAKENAPNGR